MSSLAYALILVGCSDADDQCARLQLAPVIFASQSQCRAGEEAALNSDAANRADYPVVAVRCIAVPATPKGKAASDLRPTLILAGR